MTRSSQATILDFDPEIEKTARRLKKEKLKVQQSSADIDEASASSPGLNLALELLSNESDKEEEMAIQNNNRTLRELATPNLNQQPLCIEYPNLDAAFELKSGLIHLLPTFRGLTGEDPYKHLKEFHVVCSTMKPHGITEEQIKLRAFPFSLADLAKDWLYYLPSGSIQSWNDMKQLFLERYFPASRVANIRKEICGIRQFSGETLYEYWERFKKLCSSSPPHQIDEQHLIQYFYEGLVPMDRSMIDAASGGALVDKTPEAARTLIANMAANSQQYGTRTNHAPVRVSEVSTCDYGQQISELTAMVRQLATGQLPVAKVCGICLQPNHNTDECPTLQDDEAVQQANAIGNYQSQPQKKYDPYSNTYNPGWRDHPNLSYGSKQAAPPAFPPRQQGFQPAQPQYQPKQAVPAPTGTSLEDMFKAFMGQTQQFMGQTQQFMNQTQQFQQETKTSVQDLRNQVGQLATTVGILESRGSGKLPSQTIVNPRENASAITLRNGTQLDTPPTPVEFEEEAAKEETEKSKVQPHPPNQLKNIPLPFPPRNSKTTKKDEQ